MFSWRHSPISETVFSERGRRTPMTDTKPTEFQRFNVTFRIQHVILFVTFLLLAFTGWALKYPEPALEHAGWWIRLWGGPKTAGIIHRVAGVTMVLDFLWHCIYVTYSLL